METTRSVDVQANPAGGPAVENGVSIIICCHNSAKLICATLRHLQAQQVDQINWEVLIVDNGSTDDTVDVVRNVWEENAIVNLRIVHEQRIGLAHARTKGLNSCKYEIVSFIDDDNWVGKYWVQGVYEFLMKTPNAGACGGLNIPVFESQEPFWFKLSRASFAVGPQSKEVGDITDLEGVLCGAGFTLRKSVWNGLVATGFKFRLVGRQGKRLLCGEDYELCYAIRQAGWRLWYLPWLTLQHYLPASRVRWEYLRRIKRGVGASHTYLLIYQQMDTSKYQGRYVLWCESILHALLELLRRPGKVFKAILTHGTGDIEVLAVDRAWGQLIELIAGRKRFLNMHRELNMSKISRYPHHQYGKRT